MQCFVQVPATDKRGEDFLQAHYEKVQEYKSGEHGRKARQKSNKVLKLTDARKYEQWRDLNLSSSLLHAAESPCC